MLLLALAVATAHYLLDRSDRAYLWLAMVSLATLLGNLIGGVTLVAALNYGQVANEVEG